MDTTKNSLEVTANIVGEPTTDGITCRASVTTGPAALTGLFAYGPSPAAARRALAEVVLEALEGAGTPMAPSASLRMVVPEVYLFPAAG